VHRDAQHLFGTAIAPPASWSDLSPRVYPLPCVLHSSKRMRELQEWFWIKLLLPVYNVQHNGWNPRRITKRSALLQRQRRQAGGRRFNLGAAILRAPITLGVLLILGALAHLATR
jgi:hypothetical protein